MPERGWSEQDRRFTLGHGDNRGKPSSPGGGTSDQLESVPRARIQPQSRRLARASTADRHAIAEHFGEALKCANALEAAIAAGDLHQAGIQGIELRQSLRSLWKLRAARSIYWATIVNKLQVVTSQVEFEQFTSDMAVAIRMVIESHMAVDADNDDIRASTILFERAGLSPWKTFGAPKDQQEEDGKRPA